MKQIPLTQGKFAIVDDEDFHYLTRFNWFAARAKDIFYARRKLVGRSSNSSKDNSEFYIPMEAMIMPEKHYSVIIHKNRDTLDNRKCNLGYESYSVKRHHAHRDSGLYSSRYKGVSLRKTGHPVGRPWASVIYKADLNNRDGKRHQYYLGCFATEREAALAYNKKAKELYGEDMAYQNNIE